MSPFHTSTTTTNSHPIRGGSCIETMQLHWTFNLKHAFDQIAYKINIQTSMETISLELLHYEISIKYIDYFHTHGFKYYYRVLSIWSAYFIIPQINFSRTTTALDRSNHAYKTQLAHTHDTYCVLVNTRPDMSNIGNGRETKRRRCDSNYGPVIIAGFNQIVVRLKQRSRNRTKGLN